MEFLKEGMGMMGMEKYMIMMCLGYERRKIFCQNKKKMYFCKLKKRWGISSLG